MRQKLWVFRPRVNLVVGVCLLFDPDPAASMYLPSPDPQWGHNLIRPSSTHLRLQERSRKTVSLNSCLQICVEIWREAPTDSDLTGDVTTPFQRYRTLLCEPDYRYPHLPILSERNKLPAGTPGLLKVSKGRFKVQWWSTWQLSYSNKLMTVLNLSFIEWG